MHMVTMDVQFAHFARHWPHPDARFDLLFYLPLPYPMPILRTSNMFDDTIALTRLILLN